jgi:hypothetical protein
MEASRVYRGARRRFNRGKPIDSFPYLSGDSYFYSCQFYFESCSLRKVPTRFGRPQKENSIFVKVSDLNLFALFLRKVPEEKFSEFSLVLHNGDDTIKSDLLDLFASKFKRVFAVNLLKTSGKFSPVPIGLENWSYFTNGIPRDFNILISAGLPGFHERGISILQAFSVHTNRKEREACQAIASVMGGEKLESATPLQYRQALANSRYVLSPAGNGLDCHRTWEAMYLGAVPIVKKDHWPFTSHRLPVLVINEWEELLHLDFPSLSIPQNPSWSTDFWTDFFKE